MKTASDFRAIARDALRGVWVIAVIVGILASLMGGVDGTVGPEVNFNFNDGNFSASVEVVGQTVASIGDTHHDETHDAKGLFGLIFAAGVMFYAVIAAILLGIVFFILGSVIETGYSQFNLNLIDRRDLSFDTLFNYFPQWKNLAKTNFFRSLYVFLWSLLLIVPGIMKSYSYAMVPYILAEEPELDTDAALARSTALMDGNRMRLFCLHFSFIGWDILASLTFGIGHIFLTPYKQAANAAFYRDLCATELPLLHYE